MLLMLFYFNVLSNLTVISYLLQNIKKLGSNVLFQKISITPMEGFGFEPLSL